MSNEDLKTHISELQKQMQDSVLDKEDQNFIGHLMSEIVKSAGEEKEAESEGSFIDMLEEQAARFDNNHPLLASTLRQIANTLSNMGI